MRPQNELVILFIDKGEDARLYNELVTLTTAYGVDEFKKDYPELAELKNKLYQLRFSEGGRR